MQDLIIIPGISDKTEKLQLATNNWRIKYGIIPHILRFGWQGKDKNLNSRLKIANAYIDGLLNEGKSVSLMGMSASGSVVINLFCERRKEISKVVIICGQLRDSKNIPNLRNKDLTLAIKSIELSEKNIPFLTKKDKEKILTIRPIYDNFVSTHTMIIPGAFNRRVFSVNHILSIYLTTTLYSSMIAKFININTDKL